MKMIIGTINGRAISEDSDEWLDLLSAVSVEVVPVPDGASKGISHRLYQRRRELQSLYRKKLLKMADNEIADANGNSWYDHAKKQEAQDREREAERSFRYQHRRKRLPGLRRLLAESQLAVEDRTASVVQRMIAELEKANVPDDKQVLMQYGYKSIKEAITAGWVEDHPEYIGGETIELARLTLVRNFEVALSQTAWKGKGFKLRSGETPVGVGIGPRGNRFDLYVSSQVDADNRRRRRKRCEQCKLLFYEVSFGSCPECHQNKQELANYIAENGLIPAVGRWFGK